MEISSLQVVIIIFIGSHLHCLRNQPAVAGDQLVGDQAALVVVIQHRQFVMPFSFRLADFQRRHGEVGTQRLAIAQPCDNM